MPLTGVFSFTNKRILNQPAQVVVEPAAPNNIEHIYNQHHTSSSSTSSRRTPQTNKAHSTVVVLNQGKIKEEAGAQQPDGDESERRRGVGKLPRAPRRAQHLLLARRAGHRHLVPRSLHVHVMHACTRQMTKLSRHVILHACCMASKSSSTTITMRKSFGGAVWQVSLIVPQSR